MFDLIVVIFFVFVIIRKQLENLKPQDDSKSISSTSTISGSGNPSISSSNGSNSQMGFLDEIKKLAEKRSSENGLITDTLNKTRNLEKMLTKGPKTSCISGQDDENRKRHGNVHGTVDYYHYYNVPTIN